MFYSIYYLELSASSLAYYSRFALMPEGILAHPSSNLCQFIIQGFRPFKCLPLLPSCQFPKFSIRSFISMVGEYSCPYSFKLDVSQVSMKSGCFWVSNSERYLIGTEACIFPYFLLIEISNSYNLFGRTIKKTDKENISVCSASRREGADAIKSINSCIYCGR